MGVSLSGHLPLDHDSQQGEGRPHPKHHPRQPTHRFARCCFYPLVHVQHQGEELYEVVQRHGDHRRTEHGGRQRGEETLPLQGEHGEQHAQAKQHAKGHPDGTRRAVGQLLQADQGGHGDQQAQQQAHHKEAHAANQHGDQAAERADAQADAHRGLHAQLGVQHALLVAEHEDDDRAEHQAREEHHSFEAAIAWKKRRKQMTQHFWFRGSNFQECSSSTFQLTKEAVNDAEETAHRADNTGDHLVAAGGVLAAIKPLGGQLLVGLVQQRIQGGRHGEEEEEREVRKMEVKRRDGGEEVIRWEARGRGGYGTLPRCMVLPVDRKEKRWRQKLDKQVLF